jgi:hypothetical protein
VIICRMNVKANLHQGFVVGEDAASLRATMSYPFGLFLIKLICMYWISSGLDKVRFFFTSA